jgi:hypothetical protein
MTNGRIAGSVIYQNFLKPRTLKTIAADLMSSGIVCKPPMMGKRYSRSLI